MTTKFDSSSETIWAKLSQLGIEVQIKKHAKEFSSFIYEVTKDTYDNLNQSKKSEDS